MPSGATIYNGGVAQLGERVNGIHEVRGSIPLASIRVGWRCRITSCAGGAERIGWWPAPRGNSSVGRAQPCQGWGRGFESRFPLSEGGRTQVAGPTSRGGAV